MARPREFDADRALERMMRTFWSKGYGATSYEDLTRAAKVKKQSLYGAFGDKHELFLKSLQLYCDTTLRQVRDRLQGAPTPWQGIERVLRFAVQPHTRKACPPGCLMANTALELGERDPEAAAIVRQMFQGMERQFADVLKQAQARGQVTRKLGPKAMARMIMNTLNGVRILERSGASHGEMKSAVESLMAVLCR